MLKLEHIYLGICQILTLPFLPRNVSGTETNILIHGLCHTETGTLSPRNMSDTEIGAPHLEMCQVMKLLHLHLEMCQVLKLEHPHLGMSTKLTFTSMDFFHS